MAPAGSLDSLDQLRTELSGLLQKRLIQADGSLDRRGIEVDHHLYEPQEGRKLSPRSDDDEPGPPSSSPVETANQSAANAIPRPTSLPPSNHPDLAGRVHQLEAALTAIHTENQELRGELAACRQQVERLESDLQQLREALGA
jgi:hypothetical protein